MKKIITILFYVSCILLGIGLAVFDIDLTLENMFLIFMIIFAIVLIYYIIWIIYFKIQFKKYLSNNNLNLNNLLKKIDMINNKQLEIIYKINLSVAYSLRKDYQRAIEVLKRIDGKRLNTKTKVIYYNNLAYFLYKNDQIDEAKTVLNDYNEIFNKYLTDITLAPILTATIEEIKND